MRHHIGIVIIAVCCLFTCMLTGGVTFAQGATKSAKKSGASGDAAGDLTLEDIKVRKLIGLGTQSLVKSPEFRVSAMRGIKPLGDWAQITLKFDTTPEWIDELTFDFFALAKDSRDQFSFYKGSVRYVDIEKGRDHLAVMYVRPSTLKRYGQLVAVGVEVISKGKTIAAMSDPAPKEGNVADAWWKQDMKSSVTPRDGCLLDRSQSPFALISIDDYEVIK
jgi:hypothetical protein